MIFLIIRSPYPEYNQQERIDSLSKFPSLYNAPSIYIPSWCICSRSISESPRHLLHSCSGRVSCSQLLCRFFLLWRHWLRKCACWVQRAGNLSEFGKVRRGAVLRRGFRNRRRFQLNPRQRWPWLMVQNCWSEAQNFFRVYFRQFWTFRSRRGHFLALKYILGH